MIRLTLDNVEELQRHFDPASVVKALDRSIAAAAARVRTGVSRDVRQRYNVKAGDVSRSVTLRPVRRGEVLDRLLVWTGGRLGLEKFGMRTRTTYGAAPGKGRRTKRKGVTVVVLKGEGRQVVPGAFPGRGRNSQAEFAFQRIGDKRLPIRKLTGPAIPTMVQNPDVITKAGDLAGEVLRTEFTRQMELLMAKTGGAG